MECLSSIFDIGKSFWEVTGKWFVCLIGINSNLQNLKTKIEKLRSQEEDLNRELIAAEQIPGKTRKKEVEYWLKDVQTIKSDVQKLEKQVVEERNVLVRAWLGKCILEKIDEVPKLQENGRFSNGLVIDAPPTRGRFLPTERFFGGTTCQRNMEKVWEHLMNDEVRRIGVYGMAGAGKTTIMKHINNELLQQGPLSFDNVVWVASKALDIHNATDEIAKAMDIDFSNHEDETKRVCKLHQWLDHKKRFVLILDDLWESFPLEKVGIPDPTSCKGCKLVITTQSREVCRKMECKPVEVELLTEQEALDLFMSKAVEQETILAPEVKVIARKVAKQCGRLPLAVITVARSIRGRDVKDIREWRNALDQLNRSTKQMRDSGTDVFEELKFSYTRLKDEKLQNCFLYCALYPKHRDIPKEELIDYWIFEGLIAEMNKREAINEGHAILNKLVNTCLLESTKGYNSVECVRMHDLIRDMALKITETRFMVHAGDGLEILPYEDWSEDLERVSLIQSSINGLPYGEPPNCPRLTTLLLKRTHLLVIPDSFFMHMPRLTLLDLSYAGIESLPGSISNLKSLQGLFLAYCSSLKSVPSLEKLKALKKLELCGCEIKDAPQGIEDLVNLRYLNLCHNTNLETFPSRKLSKLSQLQFLRIDNTKIKVAAEDLLCSRQLEVVGAYFENVQEFISYVKSGQYQILEHYYLSVGVDSRSEVFVYPPETWKQVYIKGIELSGSGSDGLVLPSTISLLVIEECHCHDDVKSLLDIPSLRDAADLIDCDIYNCSGMESIFSCFSSSSFSEDCRIPLKSIEVLGLYKLPNLRVLFDDTGVVSPPSISFNLKELTLSECPRIKNVFPVAKLLHNFPNLELLYVWNCEDVEDVIGGEVTETSDSGGHHHQINDNKLLLPNLQRLDLDNLPRLWSIYKGTMLCESLKSICVQRCPELRRMPNLSVHVDREQASSSSSVAASPPALKSIEGEREWWESLQWDHDLQFKTTLQPLFFALN